MTAALERAAEIPEKARREASRQTLREEAQASLAEKGRRYRENRNQIIYEPGEP